MPEPEEIAAQEAAAKAAEEAKKLEEVVDPAKAAEDATKAAEEAQKAEDARKAAEEEEAQPPAEPALSEGAEKRIRELVAKQRASEREAEYYRGLAEGRVAKPPLDPNAPPAPLKIEDFLPTEAEFAAVGLTAENFEKAGRSYDDLLMAKSAFAMDKRRVVESRRAEEVRTREAVAKSQQTFMGRINAAAETDPGLLDILSDTTLPVSTAMAEVIRESDVAPKILRFLAANRAEGARIAQLSPLAAARELGRIEAKILATPAPDPPRRVSQAPDPVRPLTPAGVTEIDLDKIPIDDFMKKRNAQQFGAAKG
jgi:hypothetical protein